MPIDKNKAFLESVCWFVICVFMVTSVWSWVMAAIDFESEEQLHRVAAPHRKRFLRPVSSNALPNRVFLLKLGPIRPAQNSFIPLFPSQVACSNRAQRGQQQRCRLRIELRLCGNQPFHLFDPEKAPAYLEATDKGVLAPQQRRKPGMLLQESGELL